MAPTSHTRRTVVVVLLPTFPSADAHDSADQTERSPVAVILGMHRCGTSALALALQSMGLYLGEKLIPGEAADNPLGYGEDAEVVAINRSVIAALGADELSLITSQELDGPPREVALLKLKARALVRKRLGLGRPWGFKDPRTALLFPLWQAVFLEEQIAPVYVVAMRNPLSAALSLKSRNGVPVAWGCMLWLAHYAAIFSGQVNAHCIVVDYDNLLSDPAGQTARLQAALPFAASPTSLSGVLEPQLRHHRSAGTGAADANDADVSARAMEAWHWISKIAGDDLSANDPEFIGFWVETAAQMASYEPVWRMAHDTLPAIHAPKPPSRLMRIRSILLPRS